ncbi:hypothetical protein BKA70DRAFT_1485324 [Coprinopsis sp. MPI-PUGE-AT-0042]|nr:hypothetical protein BKA70DRAFT_1485324 [Coprinopsis sp. MPI-PUGE-AT-0042]
MSSVPSSQEGAIKLLFDGRTYVAGERVSGVVELDFQLALEDKIKQVKIKLRGTASTYITESTGQSTVTYHSSHRLVREDIVLWTQGTYPPPGTHILQLPFEFQLPVDLPGSFRSKWADPNATISYGIEVVADRPGFFRFNRRLGHIFPVLPTATQEEVENALRLDQGWPGEWKSVERSSEIRKRFWGEYSRVQAQVWLKFQYPALNSFPVGIPIPISIIVTTITKTMKKSETPDDAFSANPDKPLFPPPPQGAGDVCLFLDALVNIRAQGRHVSMRDKHLPMGGFGKSNAESRYVRVTPSEPVWLPAAEKGEEGKWKREVRFDTTMLLKCPPTLDLEIVKCTYELNIEIPFPGLGNSLKFQIPIHIDSGLGPFDPDAPPPPALDLPPSYFTGEHHDWDGDEKSG